MEITVDIPDAKSNGWAVESFNISEQDADWANIRTYYKPGMSNRYVVPGKYKRLTHHSQVVMSNTSAEINDHMHFIRNCFGTVIINGLGLGVCLKAILGKDDVTEITVIEISQDVIDLVAPYFNDKRLTIICADALKYKPPKGKRYNWVWHDIWTDICTDNLETMATLHRKYGRRCDNQDSWCRDILKYYKRKGW